MKANYIATKGDQKRMAMEVAKEEVERQKKLVCPACEQSIANQVAAVMLKALHDNFGFGKDRICRLIDCTESIFELCAADGKRFNALQAVEWLRDAMGIDLNKP
jgi:hypothetical protein